MSYEWQEKVFGAWRDNGFKGVLKAVTGAGKTIGGLKAVSVYLKYFPYDRVWIIANSKEVIAQWKRDAESMNLSEYLEFYTYPSAVSKMHKFDREGKLDQLPDMMVLDECHCVLANVWGQVMDFNVPRYLGLSATPNGSEKKLGGIIKVVGWDEANVADTTVHLVKFEPDKNDLARYDHKTDTIKAYKSRHPKSTYKNDSILSMLYLQRRRLVYNFKNREEYAIELAKLNKGRNIMIFCSTHAQARSIGDKCEKEGMKYTVHLSDQEGLEPFITGEVNVCISCKKLSTGFSYNDADVAILVSSPTTELSIIQTLGRVIRPKEGKHADAYILIAEGTSDEEIVKKHIFSRENIKIEDLYSIIGDNMYNYIFKKEESE